VDIDAGTIRKDDLHGVPPLLQRLDGSVAYYS